MTLDKKYAELLINVGLNVQEGQTLLINTAPEHHAFAALCTEAAYARGA